MKLLFAVCLFSCLSLSFKKNVVDSRLVVLNVAEENLKGDIATLTISITNHSSDTLEYESMACSWQNNFRTDSDTWIVFHRNDCFKDGHIIEKIAPHQTQRKTLEIVRRKRNAYQSSFDFSIRISFNYTQSIPPTTLELARKNVNKVRTAKIIWSNEIIISPVRKK